MFACLACPALTESKCAWSVLTRITNRPRASGVDEMEEDQICELKKKINEFIWQNAPNSMTLEQAEKAAVTLLVAMVPDAVPNSEETP